MSVFSFLAFAAGIAARVMRPDVEVTKLQARLDEKDCEIERLNRHIVAWQQIAGSWQARWETLVALPEEEQQAIRRARYEQQWLQSQAIMQQNLQHLQHLQQLHMPANPNLQAGLMQQAMAQCQGAQGAFCNCVPARHDAFLGGLGG